MTSIFRDSLLRGKSAFLTGGSSGIGLRIAERFAQHGASVFLVGRRQEKLDAATAAIAAAGGRVAAASVDVRDYDALAAAAARARAEFGPIDIVMAGAAGNFPAPALGMSANGFKAVIDIDLLGTFNTLRAAYEHLRRPGAAVIAISAAHATVAIPFQAHVCAAKAGVELLIRTLAIEWGGDGVRLNCISPGPIADTEGMRRLAPNKQIEDRITSSIPLRRFGTKDEIADLALFLCSDAASYITGATFACDGGHSLTASSGGMQMAWEAGPRR
jgi:NAD(P)-dependent dehydrogenase (short-subunit alcohol dehydrogenase family)